LLIKDQISVNQLPQASSSFQPNNPQKSMLNQNSPVIMEEELLMFDEPSLNALDDYTFDISALTRLGK
jgi:hypothetical protein